MSDDENLLAHLHAAIGCDGLGEFRVAVVTLKPEQGDIKMLVAADYLRRCPAIHPDGDHYFLWACTPAPTFTIGYVARSGQQITMRVRVENHGRAQQTGNSGSRLEPALGRGRS